MFYKMISRKRDIWFASEKCAVKNLVDYIVYTGKMRDAQIEAIKTYLFLKIACKNKPLYLLFTEGEFNSLNLDEIELKTNVKIFLINNPAAAALFEYAIQTNGTDKILLPNIVKRIREKPEDIDYARVFRQIFYNVSYTDYLFSLPMGAGKTYLMSAFIYLDLYFAQNEPDNDAFAHNFIIFAPSGLKTSVIPSLRTIQNFDPSWVLPEPAASALKRKLIFEFLDQNKTANKSNKTKNPNVQKIAMHNPLNELFGLVAVTNAEKVILDRIKEKDGQISMFENSDDEKDKQANELRNLIGKLPSLSIFIDEVHHAATDDKKLRAVVSKWMKNNTVNSVIGFSGTPYLQKPEKIYVADKTYFSSIEISNTVYYYPLADGIGNFLKRPSVFISNGKNRSEIVEQGIREFLNRYKDKKYADGTCAKLGIYCGGSIEILEKQIYPIAEKIVSEYGLNAQETVLKFHGGNKEHPVPVDSEMRFAMLDNPMSNVRIILLVQIGKEGWDCRSLTGIILAQEGDCPTNMVLQTACRCLRQVKKDELETAIIYLNDSNAKILNMQLERQHHMSLNEFENGRDIQREKVKRYDRTKHLNLPELSFFQLNLEYKNIEKADASAAVLNIKQILDNARVLTVIKEAEMKDKLDIVSITSKVQESGMRPALFSIWLYEIARESFGFLEMADFGRHHSELREVFKAITYERNGKKYFSSKYNIDVVNSGIRKAIYGKREIEMETSFLKVKARLFKPENFETNIMADDSKKYFPEKEIVEKIISDDEGELKPDKNIMQLLELAEKTGQSDIVELLRRQLISHPMKDRSFHYIPYKTDSGFEKIFFEEVLKFPAVKDGQLEVYYNGDKTLTDFRIKCYKYEKSNLHYIGLYTPDFLILQRIGQSFYKILIIETKGELYANDPAFKDKRKFMDIFVKENNNKYGYERFEYLYLESTMRDDERIALAENKIEKFFKVE